MNILSAWLAEYLILNYYQIPIRANHPRKLTTVEKLNVVHIHNHGPFYKLLIKSGTIAMGSAVPFILSLHYCCNVQMYLSVRSQREPVSEGRLGQKPIKVSGN